MEKVSVMINGQRKVIRVAYYIRVSTSEQVSKENSLPAQKEALDAYADEHGMKCVGLYADEGKTAAKAIRKRKAIHAMLTDIRDGKIDLVLFTRFDRFTRNPEEYFKMMETLNAAEVQWKAITQPELDMNTDMGQTLILFYLGMGRQEIANISERIKATANVRIKKGSPITGAQNLPFCFTIGADEHGDKHVVPDPVNTHIMREYIRHYELHHSKRAAMSHTNLTYGVEFSYNVYGKALKNTLLYGHYKGNDHYCMPIISKEQWDALQAIGKKNVRARKNNETYIFSQLMVCSECGCRMAGSHTIKANGKRYRYYRCNKWKISKLCNNSKIVSEIAVEKWMLENIKPEIEKYITEYEVSLKAPKKKPKIDVGKIEKERDRLNYQFRKGYVEEDEYERELESINIRITAAIESNADGVPPERDLSALRAFLTRDIESVYTTLSPAEKRVLWRSVTSEIVSDTKGKFKPKFFDESLY